MMFKIVVTFCVMMLVEARWNCGNRYYNQWTSPWSRYRNCKVSRDVTDETWYQEGALLKVLNGTFTVRLLQNDFVPGSLNAEGKRIVELERGFAVISVLKELSLEDNLIERIDGFVFEGLPKLIRLNLARNRIAHLEEDSFQGLNKLEILNLDHNSLSVLSDSINDDVLPKLTHLYLQYNRIIHRPLDVEINFQLRHSNLRRLYLSNNSISSFHETDPFYLKNLTHLFLEDNEIGDFSIENMPLLQVLSLDGNNMRHIPTITSQMKFLSMARNQVRRITPFRNAENLIALILSYNEIISAEDAGAFQNLPSLQHLVLDHNFITESMPEKYFHNLPSLRSLDLSSNNIDSYVPLKQFSNLPALQKLYLCNNTLTNFPGNESFLESKLTISYLDLSDNTISDISNLHLNMIPELIILKLTGNPLERIDPDSVPNQLTILF